MKAKVGISLNEDCSHYFFSRYGQKIDRAKLNEWVDQYAGTQVTEFLLNPNAMRTSYASKAWGAIWEGFDPQAGNEQSFFSALPEIERARARQWVETAWQIHADGIDIYQHWIARCREKDISPWISMRMNDVHGVDNVGHILHSKFWREHPEMWRMSDIHFGWSDRALDYGFKEVREHHFRLIEELMDRYDMDGLELDWMRSAFHFRPGHEANGVDLLNQFMGRVRELLDQWEIIRKHKIKLSVRVPSRPQTALGLGMDAVTWARKGFVDMIVATPFYATIETDVPIEIWKQLLEGTKTKLAVGLELMISPSPGYGNRQTNSLETVRGAAFSFLARGVDRIYLFNYMDSETAMDDLQHYPQLLREVGELESMRNKPRRHVMTFADTWAVGEPVALPLPAVCNADTYHQFRIHVGTVSPQKALTVIVGFETDEVTHGDCCDVSVNGQPCAYIGLQELTKPVPVEKARGYRIIPNQEIHGYAIIEIRSHCQMTIGWLEIQVAE